MGKKINPKVLRIKKIKTWDSRWFSDKNYQSFLEADIKLKKFLYKKLEAAFVGDINIERTEKEVNIIIHAARPGVIIGRGGSSIEDLKKEISRKFIKNPKINVKLNIKEVENQSLDARVIAQSIKLDIEKRMPFRRAMKQAVSRVERARAKGVKIQLSGRLNGVEIARSEKLISGKVPLHTFRADIDYAFVEANTIYGVIGIKVWIYRGDIFNKKREGKNNIKKKEK